MTAIDCISEYLLFTKDSINEDKMSVLKDDPAVHIFLSYAATSRKDTQLVHTLRRQLSYVRQQGRIDESYDSAQSGSEHLVRPVLDAAHSIVLLIGADSMEQDSCVQIELTQALERHNTEGISLIPVLAAPTELEGSPLEQLTLLPKDRRPVSARTNIGMEQALLEVANEIRQTAGKLARSIQTSAPTAEALYQQARDVDTRVLGPCHPDMAPVLRNLAYLLQQRGR